VPENKEFKYRRKNSRNEQEQINAFSGMNLLPYAEDNLVRQLTRGVISQFHGIILRLGNRFRKAYTIIKPFTQPSHRMKIFDGKK
jgi:hypothetical protein